MNQQGKTETLVSAALPDKTVGNVLVDNPRITARGVNVFYGDKQAIDRVTLDIAEKQVISFIGPSGCGKSTFLRCLNRMNDTIDICRIEGEIALDGKNIYAPDVDVVPLRARVGMVFQKPNPFPKSIYDNVAYGPRIHGLAAGGAELDEIVEMSLERAGLWNEVKDRLQQPGTGLSGGQQQRVGHLVQLLGRGAGLRPMRRQVQLFDRAVHLVHLAPGQQRVTDLRETILRGEVQGGLPFFHRGVHICGPVPQQRQAPLRVACLRAHWQRGTLHLRRGRRAWAAPTWSSRTARARRRASPRRCRGTRPRCASSSREAPTRTGGRCAARRRASSRRCARRARTAGPTGGGAAAARTHRRPIRASD